MDKNVIKAGDYVIILRGGFTKLHKIKEKTTSCFGPLGIVELDNVLQEKYFDSFQLKLKEGRQKFYILEKMSLNTIKELSIGKSGSDNRYIIDDGTSQSLMKEDLTKLRDESISSNENKEDKKCCEYIQILRPTIRILAQMFYRQDPQMTLGLRIDDLSQILCYANIQSEGNYILYDSGTSGLMAAAVLNAIGPNTSGKLIHAHPANKCDKTAVLAMQFSAEHLERLVNVNLHSLLCSRQQIKTGVIGHLDAGNSATQVAVDELRGEPWLKKRKLSTNGDEPMNRKTWWQVQNEKACNILENKVDSVIVAAKEYPLNIVKELIPFLGASRTLVVFCLLKEPLQDLFMFLKNSKNFINLKLSNNFTRLYQVLPEQTHPMVNMHSRKGYILYGNKVC